jgi:hypothetical protein
LAALVISQDLFALISITVWIAEPSRRITPGLGGLHSAPLIVEGSLLEMESELLIDVIAYPTPGC